MQGAHKPREPGTNVSYKLIRCSIVFHVLSCLDNDTDTTNPSSIIVGVVVALVFVLILAIVIVLLLRLVYVCLVLGCQGYLTCYMCTLYAQFRSMCFLLEYPFTL